MLFISEEISFKHVFHCFILYLAFSKDILSADISPLIYINYHFYNKCFLSFILCRVSIHMAFIFSKNFVFLPFLSAFWPLRLSSLHGSFFFFWPFYFFFEALCKREHVGYHILEGRNLNIQNQVYKNVTFIVYRWSHSGLSLSVRLGKTTYSIWHAHMFS